MAFTNYTTLQAAVATWLERDDLTTEIVDLIALAETEIRNKLRVREMISRSSITVNARQISVPTRFAEAISLKLLTNPVRTLQYLNQDRMDAERVETTGKPEFFTIHTEIEFDKTPDDSYSGEILYYQYPDALASTSTNSVLTNYPAVYLYGALKESAPLLMHDERVQLWEAKFNQAVAEANATTQKTMRAGPQVPRVVGRGP